MSSQGVLSVVEVAGSTFRRIQFSLHIRGIRISDFQEVFFGHGRSLLESPTFSWAVKNYLSVLLGDKLNRTILPKF